MGPPFRRASRRYRRASRLDRANHQPDMMNSAITPEQFEILLPLACGWAAAQEKRILATGEALSDTMLNNARLVGVTAPERVRLLFVPEIPIPDDQVLRAAVEETQFLSPLTRGLTLCYGIFIRSDCRADETMVVHELGHVAQYERLGGFEPFLRRYIFECLTLGYPEAPMEQAVIALTAQICGSRRSPDWAIDPMPGISDGYDCFRELVQELRREHFDEAAGKIDSLLHRVAWTTGSELVGELGAAIRDFERSQPLIAPSLRAPLDRCARIVVRVWPDFPK